ncbi:MULTISPECIES: hypothetical protein [unclassified Streptomyces]|uniref:hypothetical protein n=1 Tax=unclassified Streptomyces TaxID=2593676 RepID=UPI0021C69DE5|nr:hypothetical protein [Streptomyces sp. wa22]
MLIEAIDEWGTRIGRSLPSFGEGGSSATERYEAMWAAIIKSFQDDRTLWLATLEALLQAEHSDDLRRYLAGSQALGRQGLAALLLGTPEDEAGDTAARTLGAAQMALSPA